MHECWKDARAAVRAIVRAPALAAAVAATIGLGVGASLAILGLLHETVIGASPYRDPAALVVLENSGRYYYGGRLSEGLPSPHLSGPDFLDIERNVRTLSAVGAIARFDAVMTGGDRPRPVWRTLVSRRLMPLLGSRALVGRLLLEADFEPSAPPAAVLTESMWRHRFGGDPAVLGRTIRLDDQPFQVVGVVADAFLSGLVQPEGLLDRVEDEQVISPLVRTLAGSGARRFTFMESQRDAAWVSAFGRIAPGHSLDSVRSELEFLSRRLAADHPATNAKRRLRVAALGGWYSARVAGTATMLLGAALLVFLVASCNAAGLTLAESVRRESETAIRQALGAGTGRIVRLEFTRAVILAVPGGLLALLVGAAVLFAVDRVLGGGAGMLARGLLLPRVAGAGVAITCLAGLAGGAAAAWSLRSRTLTDALKEGGSTASASRRRQRLARALVAVQVASATALLLGCGMMLRSVRNILDVDMGFDVGRAVVVEVRLPPARYPQGADQRAFFQQALQRVRRLPGVVAAGAAVTTPLTNSSQLASGVDLILPSGEKRTPERLNTQSVMPGYLESFDIKLLRGRWLSDADYQGGQAALVDQAFCERYLGKADPLQTRVSWNGKEVPIVGLVANVRRDGPLTAPADTLYVMETFEEPSRWVYLVARARGNPAEAGRALLHEVSLIDPGVATEDPQTIEELFRGTFATRRRLLLLLGSASVIVLLLTALSLVSALTQYAAARRRELAIRVALGANGRRVAALLVRHVTVALGLGLGVGLAAGLLLARSLSDELFHVTAWDPASIAGALAVVALLSAAALAGPLWRTSRMDPTASLRSQ
jgi:putative ABC transport system permease protein